VDRLGDFLLAQSDRAPGRNQTEYLHRECERSGLRGVYHKLLDRRVRGVAPTTSCPRLFRGEPAPDRFVVRENGVQFELSFAEGYSSGLFLDQRENRRRLLQRHVAADFALWAEPAPAVEVLNVFAYTCAFSVCAALAGARTTSLDLSKKHLEWGRRNFALNGLDPAAHDFIFGDAFDWLRRLARKTRRFDLVLLDPPTFSTSKTGGAFRAELDFGRLVAGAVKLVQPGGVLFASTNAARLSPEDWVATVSGAIAATGRRILRQHFGPQPPDFPIRREEPGYLKTLWLRLD
jgi:23S rRNA (cytosine1962-C5)-methyltransferase